MSHFWHSLYLLLFVASFAANAELVTFQFQGHIMGASPDLSAVFQSGRPYSLSYTFETTTTPQSPGLFVNCVRDVQFNYDNSTYIGTMDPSTMSGTIRVSPAPFNFYTFIVGMGDNVIPTSIEPPGAVLGFPDIGNFRLLNATVNISAPFSTYNLPTTLDLQAAQSETFTLRFQGVGGIPSLSGTLENLQVVPEPSTWLFLAGAPLVFVLARRHKRGAA